jgi:DNA polymerase-3 subunit beta
VFGVMHITVDRKTLAQRLALVTPAATTARSAITALSGVHIATSTDGSITLAATDNSLSITATLQATTIEEPGQTLLNASLLLALVKKLPGHSVEIVIDQGAAMITSGNAQFDLPQMRLADFPPLPTMPERQATLPTGALQQTITKVARFAAAKDDHREILQAVHLSIDGTTLRMMTTDSYRLALATATLDHEVPGDEITAALPAINVLALDKLISATGAEHITLGIDQARAVIQTGPATLTTRLTSGQYPDFRHMLDQQFAHTIPIDGSELAEVVDRLALVSLDPLHPMTLAFTDGTLTLSAATSDIGRATEEVPMRFYGTEPLSIGFNPGFLIDGLRTVPGGDVTLSLNGAQSPALIRSASDDSMAYLLMPVRLKI